jgi:hypothetical protein
MIPKEYWCCESNTMIQRERGAGALYRLDSRRSYVIENTLKRIALHSCVFNICGIVTKVRGEGAINSLLFTR